MLDTLEKPVKKLPPHEPMYYLNEVADYIKAKYGRSIFDWEGKYDIANKGKILPLHDLIDYIEECEGSCIHNDEILYIIYDKDILIGIGWVRKIFDILVEENFLELMEDEENTYEGRFYYEEY